MCMLTHLSVLLPLPAIRATVKRGGIALCLMCDCPEGTGCCVCTCNRADLAKPLRMIQAPTQSGHHKLPAFRISAMPVDGHIQAIQLDPSVGTGTGFDVWSGGMYCTTLVIYRAIILSGLCSPTRQ